MTRFGFFLFNILLVVLLYGIVYQSGEKHAALGYTLTCFSLPYIGLIFFMAIFAIIRWFLGQNPDVAKEAVTLLNATWFLIVLTIIAIKVTGGAPHGIVDIIHMIR
jgi:hypothetical protein